ncbi:portal protein [Methylobacterium sp. Leaf108]|uniref:portal protein n=1 Tax=Methylobacterium sp. Leaf108 TaxID=1736256 RepID=UPI0006FE9246|nr:portal protein [Methylobacterium sp. Leaf108]KQP50827.1 hypothetical protein ASF39_11325 [Methylobacterium sp. Leaf108]
MNDIDDDAGAPGADKREAMDRDALVRRLKAWYRIDRDASAIWRKEAREDYDMVAGRQWSTEDEAVLKEQGRPPITFNRMLPVIKAVAGSEVNSRQDIQYLPREIGDAAKNELLTEAGRYLADEAQAEDEESDAFVDCAITGMGWVEMRLDYETNPDGAYVEDRVDPLEMIWDSSARKRNLADGRRLFRAKTMDRVEAEGLFPDAEPTELDAAWAENRDDDAHDKIAPGESRADRGLDRDAGSGKVTIVECQWWERKRVVMVIDPTTREPTEMDEAKAATLLSRAATVGITMQTYRVTKRVYRRAFIGATVLEVGPAPAGDQFSYACLTGDRDHNKGTWFGIIRAMKDPQRYANKWLSQTLDMLNRQAKGGMMMEKGAVPDQAAFERSYAKPGGISWVNDGALMGGRMKEKPLPQLPAGHYQLMEFAIMSIRDSSGVNLELLGQKQQEQAGVLEYQRKQAAMTILATLFDALRRARKHIGRVRLYFIQTYLSDGRLVRIAGDGAKRVVPLLRDSTMGEYDVIIDDAPASPNQKEVIWSTFTSVFPVIKDMITPQVLFEILPYSPFPDSFVAKMRDLLSQAGGSSPEAQAQAGVAMQTAMAKIQDLTAGANLKNAKAAREGAGAERDGVEAAIAQLTMQAGPPMSAAA